MKKIVIGKQKFIRLTKLEWNNNLTKGGFPYEYVFANDKYVYFKDE